MKRQGFRQECHRNYRRRHRRHCHRSSQRSRVHWHARLQRRYSRVHRPPRCQHQSRMRDGEPRGSKRQVIKWQVCNKRVPCNHGYLAVCSPRMPLPRLKPLPMMRHHRRIWRAKDKSRTNHDGKRPIVLVLHHV